MNMINRPSEFVGVSESLATLVEEHKAAHQAFHNAIDRQNEVEEAYEAAHYGGKSSTEVLVPLSIGGAVSLWLAPHRQEYEVDHCRDRIIAAYDQRTVCVARLHDAGVLSKTALVETSAALKRARANDLRAMQRLLRAEAQRQEEFGFAQAMREWQAASEAETAAAVRLLRYSCLTMEEVRTRAEYVTQKKGLGRLIYDGLRCGTEEMIDALLQLPYAGDWRQPLAA